MSYFVALALHLSRKNFFVELQVVTISNFNKKNSVSLLGHSTEKLRKFIKTIDSMLKLKLRALKCFFNFLSTMILHGVWLSLVKNAGLATSCVTQKNRREIFK